MRLNLQLTDVSFISYTMVEDTGVKRGYLYIVSSQIDLITCIYLGHSIKLVKWKCAIF